MVASSSRPGAAMVLHQPVRELITRTMTLADYRTNRAAGVIAGAGWCLAVGLQSLRYRDMSTSLVSLWNLGLGQIGAITLITSGLGLGSTNRGSVASTSKLMGSVLLANTPQGFFSVLYLMYNGLFTCMLTEKEWQTFAHTRMPLRVSAPQPGQHSTYYLQLPYLYSIPLLFFSGLMHWLISQSIFLAYVQSYDNNGVRNPGYDIVTCGYSPIAIVMSLFIGCLMVLAFLLLGLQQYPAGLPLARNRSDFIKAACVRPPRDSGAATASVMWGLREKDGESRYVFSSYEVQTLPYQAAKYKTASESWDIFAARICLPCRQLRAAVHRRGAICSAEAKRREKFAKLFDKD